jgi:hypothetical protein
MRVVPGGAWCPSGPSLHCIGQALDGSLLPLTGCRRIRRRACPASRALGRNALLDRPGEEGTQGRWIATGDRGASCHGRSVADGVKACDVSSLLPSELLESLMNVVVTEVLQSHRPDACRLPAQALREAAVATGLVPHEQVVQFGEAERAGAHMQRRRATEALGLGGVLTPLPADWVEVAF